MQFSSYDPSGPKDRKEQITLLKEQIELAKKDSKSAMQQSNKAFWLAVAAVSIGALSLIPDYINLTSDIKRKHLTDSIAKYKNELRVERDLERKENTNQLKSLLEYYYTRDSLVKAKPQKITKPTNETN